MALCRLSSRTPSPPPAPVSGLPPQTYPFAVTAKAVWDATHAYVAAVIASANTRAPAPLIESDVLLRDWVKQVREWMPTFPDIHTDAELVDA